MKEHYFSFYFMDDNINKYQLNNYPIRKNLNEYMCVKKN